MGDRTSLCVVSPHFDDAIYSAFVALTLPGLKQRAVATVITIAPAGKVTAWATHTGFKDTGVEHLARAQEDIAVLAELGVQPVHLGGVSESSASLQGAVEEFARVFLAAPQEWVFLLPAGAGRHVGRVARLCRRILKRPLGQMAHPEHTGSRDALRRRLRATPGAQWGYYVEHPYVTFDSVSELGTRLRSADRAPLRRVQYEPDPQAKLHSAQGYVSQARVALGTTPAEQLTFASRAELYFLR
ncbi:MAG: hypothetical protein ABIP38_03035 [Steroidobacteraceae bacterium]